MRVELYTEIPKMVIFLLQNGGVDLYTAKYSNDNNKQRLKTIHNQTNTI